mmetsp:Transcript_3673/g.4909  ORF Transcript_3673/g.4909 Transcript_3673/m.4909 type:complete len:104 (+) Transcript_3673:642-953(+)
MARTYIDSIYATYDEKRSWLEAEPDNKQHRIEKPYEEMELILNDFYSNEELNNAQTMVAGEDLCKIFDVNLFLAELIEAERKRAVTTGVKMGKIVKAKKVEIA